MFRSSWVCAFGLLGFLCACSSDESSSKGDAGSSGDANLGGSSGDANLGGSSGETNLGGSSGDANLGGNSGDTNLGGSSGETTTDAGVDSGTDAGTRTINVSDDRPEESISFFPEDANPSAVRWYNAAQVARFKRMLEGNTLPVRAKLVIVLNGVGGSAGPNDAAEWITNRGFHTLTVDYDNLVSVRLLPDSMQNDGMPGAIEAYAEIIEGVDYSTGVNVPKADSVFGRIEAGLAYLAGIDPGADWGYYLNADGSLRLGEIIFYGYSFGGATSTVVGKRHDVARVVAASAPRYETDTTTEWLQGPTVTPLDRFYSIVGTQDPDFALINATVDALGLPGALVDTTAVTSPYTGSHRLQTNLGHVAMCTGTELDAVCEYAFGVAP